MTLYSRLFSLLSRRTHLSSQYLFFFLMIRRPPRSTLDRSSAASDVYKRQHCARAIFAAAQKSASSPQGRASHRSWQGRRRASGGLHANCLLYTSPSPRDRTRSRMPSSACKKTKQNKKNKNTSNTQMNTNHTVIS